MEVRPHDEDRHENLAGLQAQRHGTPRDDDAHELVEGREHEGIEHHEEIRQEHVESEYGKEDQAQNYHEHRHYPLLPRVVFLEAQAPGSDEPQHPQGRAYDYLAGVRVEEVAPEGV